MYPHAIYNLVNSTTDVFDSDYHKIMSFVTPSLLFKQSALTRPFQSLSSLNLMRTPTLKKFSVSKITLSST